MADSKPIYSPPTIERIAPFFATSSAKMPSFFNAQQPKAKQGSPSSFSANDKTHLPTQTDTEKTGKG
ncbi:MAG: hypothetical protein KJ558_04610 [Gammaproteobacteria bacterium]|nr:hypothetical protein [Gammaproteobacteria bacterium]MBU1654102.1 hypothetical protein [Gammaproteobacteria bacterium]MBU1961681.1 hypothetical protein [Gammaproteobacteria bacterium]